MKVLQDEGTYKVRPVGERRRSRSRNALGLQAGGERGLSGARLCAARLKSLVHFTSRSSLPMHQLSGSRLLEFPDPWIHPCQNPGNILASTATFYIFSRSCIPPTPRQLPNLSPTQPSDAGPGSLHVLPCIPVGFQTRSPKKKWGYAHCLIL